MKDIGLEIKKLASVKNITKIELAKHIGKSTKSLYNYLENKTVIDVQTLQKIADVFQVPITYFFDDGVLEVLRDSNVTINEYYSENSELKKQIKEKETLILFFKEREFINQETFIEISKILKANNKKIEKKILENIKQLVKIKSLIAHKTIIDFTE